MAKAYPNVSFNQADQNKGFTVGLQVKFRSVDESSKAIHGLLTEFGQVLLVLQLITNPLKPY